MFKFLGLFLLFVMSSSEGQSVFENPITSLAPIAANSISAHVLDIANGKTGNGVQVTSYHLENDGNWKELAVTTTDSNGRSAIVHPDHELVVGLYKLRFETRKYFEAMEQKTFYPYAEIVFQVDDASKHYHIPLTLSNYGYTTYKGQ